jgi:hypothetical protein
MKLTKHNKVEIEGKEYRIRWEPHLLNSYQPVKGTEGKWESLLKIDHSGLDRGVLFYSGLLYIIDGEDCYSVELDSRRVGHDWLDEEEIEFEPCKHP